MEKQRKARSVIRAAFTRTHTSLRHEIEKENRDVDEIKALFALFKEKASELEDMNDKIFQLMQNTDETRKEDMSKEIEGADEYRIRYQQMKVSVARYTDPAPPQFVNLPPLPNLPANIRVNQAAQDKRFKLPKIELQKFGGDLKEWLLFWSLFKNIHEDPTIARQDKFQYLMQAMVKGSRAYELINSFPPTAENYDKAIDSLKSRFGKDELLIEVYIRELLKLVLNNTAKKDAKVSIVGLYDKLETQLRVLESLNVTTEMCAAMLYPLVESSLPEELLRTWQRHPSSNVTDTKERLTNLMTFLQSEVEAEERIAMAVSGFGISTKDNRDKKAKNSRTETSEIPTAAELFNAKETRIVRCIFCNENHDSAQCDKAKKMSIEERTGVVKDRNACFYCLKVGHNCRKCRYKERCGWCGKKHVLLMCRFMSADKSKTTDNTEKKTEEQSLSNLSLNPRVLLQTLRVKLVSGSKERIIRAVLDTGSHRSYILGRVAEQFEFEQLGEQTMTHLLFGGTKTAPQVHRCYRIHLRSLDNSYACNFTAFHQDTICQNILQSVEGSLQKELRQKSIQLSDTGADNQPISLLIGADILGKLYTGKMQNLTNGITAMETRLGWTLMGKVPNDQEDTALMISSMFSSDASLESMWKLDVLGIEDPIQKSSKEEHQKEILKNFQETTKINSAGRYEVILSWKENHAPLCENREVAEKRLENTLKRLRDSKLLDEYEKVFDEWLNENIIEIVPEGEVSKPGFYLPHRPVIKENSTTRIRPVFDASVKGIRQPSLNECLETGPNFIELIPSLLLRFRENKIGITADIRKAFLQISVAPKERDVMRFLWKRTQDPKNFVIYRHCRVVFGISSSPFLLGATIDLHLEQTLKESTSTYETTIIQKLRQSFYVDNCVTSIESREEAIMFKEKTVSILARGGFELREWRYSDKVNSDEKTPVLGLIWDTYEDTLMLSPSTLSQKTTSKVTKREILSSAQKIFDPLGIACPVELKPKLLLKKLWDKNVDWDVEVENDVKKAFLQWQQELQQLCQLKIPRWALGNNKIALSLHLFVDASQEAYGAVIFSRIKHTSGVDVHFIQAKSRISPRERATIPRLELLGASIEARLMNNVVTALDNQEIERYYWSDSSTVLTWIQRETRWATFVWNRVQEIRQLSNPEAWRYVPGDMNPADLVSRGCNAKQFIESRWWEGPPWLKLPSESWPKSCFSINESLVASESRNKTRQDKTLYKDVRWRGYEYLLATVSKSLIFDPRGCYQQKKSS